MTDAYLDTTILTDVLLKTGSIRDAAIAALKRYEHTLLPVYAIKEFKAGPLRNFVWMHNKLASLGSFEKALAALHAMSRTPKRYVVSTALEALKSSAGSIASCTSEDLLKKYGIASIDEIMCNEYRIAIKVAVLKAWKRRHRVTTEVVDPLPCYKQEAPYEERACLIIEPTKCDPRTECSLAMNLKGRKDELKLLKDTVDSQPDKPENRRRAKTLRQLFRTPKIPMTENNFRDLGDAYFALFCPKGASIITTNKKDHGPLAEVLGKEVDTP